MKIINKGFTLVEVIVYIAILSLVLLLVSSFIFYFELSNSRAKGDREALEGARRALETITYEIQGAKSIYTPTTTANQLSLETSRYLPTGETTTYIDFFLCGTRVCLKKESQTPVFVTAANVNITSLIFTQTSIGAVSSVKIDITSTYSVAVNGVFPSTTLSETATFRN